MPVTTRAQAKKKTEQQQNRAVPIRQSTLPSIPLQPRLSEDYDQQKMAILHHPNYPRLDDNYRAVVEGRATVKNLFTCYPPNVAYQYILRCVYNELYNHPEDPLPEIQVVYKNRQEYDNLFL
jgi:hypothetical protein